MERTPPRLVINITEQQFRDLQRLIPHGLKTRLFQTLVDDMIELLEDEDPELVIGFFTEYKVIYDITPNKRNNGT